MSLQNRVRSVFNFICNYNKTLFNVPSKQVIKYKFIVTHYNKTLFNVPSKPEAISIEGKKNYNKTLFNVPSKLYPLAEFKHRIITKLYLMSLQNIMYRE